MQYETRTHRIQINTNKFTHSEMGPVWQNPIWRTVRTAHLSVLMTVHSFSTQYNKEQFWQLPSYLQTNIMAQMWSIRGEGASGRNTFVQNYQNSSRDQTWRSNSTKIYFFTCSQQVRQISDQWFLNFCMDRYKHSQTDTQTVLKKTISTLHNAGIQPTDFSKF